MPYIMRHAKSMTLIFTSTFETKAQAIEQAEGMGLHVGLDVTVEDLQAYGLEAQKQLLQFKAEEARCTVIEEAVTAFLEDAIENQGYSEGDHLETDALAEAIGFDFTETAEYRVVLTVTVNKKRGYEVDDDNLAIEVESHYGDFTVDDFNIESIREQ